MSKISILIFALFACFSAFSCEVYDSETLLVNKEKIEVDVYAKPVVKLVAKEVGPVTIFGARVLESYAGFECEVTDVTKLSQGCWEVRVEWSPGADFSGCDVEVSSSSGKVYHAFLYMDYHAHL